MPRSVSHAVPETPRLPRALARWRLALPLGLLALSAASCGGDDAPELGSPPAGDVTITADAATFTPDEVELPSGREVVVVLEIQDGGLAHNIHFPDVSGDPKTRLEKGPRYQTLTVAFDEPGEYRYVCDLHPTMRGVAVAT
ncbi:MAG: hypothetical protein GEV08_01275 [Acidimicrobiia bacterium]|nr:hypothetical protein [Acidimicrobiia bacterium]